MARKSRKAKGSTLSVDFSGIETLAKMEEGEQLLKVAEVTQEEGDKAPYLKWVLENEDGARVWNNTSLSKQSLWNLKAFLEALGQEVPQDEMDIDLEELVDCEVMGMIENETYEGKKKPRLVDFWPVESDGKKGKKDSSEEEPDFDEMDEDDLAKFVKKNKLDVDLEDLSVKKARKTVAEAYEEANEKPVKGKKGAKGKEKPEEDEVNEMDEDDLEKTISHFDLEVDLSKYKTLRKMRAAVVEALEG